MSGNASTRRIEAAREAISGAANDPAQMAARIELANFVSLNFDRVGTLLHVSGDVLGPDTKSGASPFGHGSDETVAISLLLRITSQLVSATADLLLDGRSYAAAALIRQMVEIEYLAWAFESRDRDAERWLRSSKDEGRNSSRRPSSGKLPENASGAKTTDTTANWAAIRSRFQGSCFAPDLLYLKCCCRTRSAMRAGSGIIL